MPVNANSVSYYQVNFKGFVSAWQPVSIADARLTITEDADQQKTARFDISSQYYAFLETLYPLRFCVESNYSVSQKRSHFYRELQQGADQSSMTIAYDWDKKLAKQTIVETKEDLDMAEGSDIFGADPISSLPVANKKQMTIKDIPLQQALALDYLSALVQIQTADWSTQQQQIVPIVVKGEQRLNKAVLLGNETIEYNGDQLDTYKIMVTELEMNGELRSDEPIYIWLSQQKKQGILQIMLDHSLGSFVIQRMDTPVNIDSACEEILL